VGRKIENLFTQITHLVIGKDPSRAKEKAQRNPGGERARNRLAQR
jgi:hypothetical protein